MTQRLVMLVALCSFWFYFSGCKENDNSTASLTSWDVIVPLSVGNQWIYLVTDSTASSGRFIVDTITVQIIRDTTIQNEKWYMAERHSHTFIPTDASKKYNTALWINRADGHWVGPYGPGMQFLLYLAVKYPASVNDSWQLPQWDYTYPIITPTVISTNVRVDVPAGQFVCYEIEYRDSVTLVPSKAYYAINIGLIKSEPELGQTIREELLSYTILKM
jgi:hypothetical protein